MDYFSPNPLQSFSDPGDTKNYNDKLISNDVITEVFQEFVSGSRERESEDYLRTLSGKSQFTWLLCSMYHELARDRCQYFIRQHVSCCRKGTCDQRRQAENQSLEGRNHQSYEREWRDHWLGQSTSSDSTAVALTLK